MTVAGALSISDAASVTGLSPHTLRYYERAGLMLDRGRREANTSASRRATKTPILP